MQLRLTLVLPLVLIGCATGRVPRGSGDDTTQPDAATGGPTIDAHIAVSPDAHVNMPDAFVSHPPDAQTCVPTTELCNGVDDNCNGQIDEAYVLGASCSAGVGACTAYGTTQCAPGGTTTQCSAVAGTPTAEVCGNGIDEDCNGVADDGCSTGGTCAHGVCTTGVALDPACDTCVNDVCFSDSFCCTVTWDSFCVSDVNFYCTTSFC